MATIIKLISEDDGTISYCSCVDVCKSIKRLSLAIDGYRKMYEKLQKEVNNAVQKPSTKKMDV